MRGRGRNFTAQDDACALNVAIVNQTFAHKFFSNDDAQRGSFLTRHLDATNHSSQRLVPRTGAGPRRET
jgi:hypothetical protein